MTDINVVVDKDWHHVKDKSKGKSMNRQHNSVPTTSETTWQGTLGTKEGPQKVPWQQ